MENNYDCFDDLPDNSFGDFLFDIMNDDDSQPFPAEAQTHSDFVFGSDHRNQLLPIDHSGLFAVGISNSANSGAFTGSVAVYQNVHGIFPIEIPFKEFDLNDQLSVNGVPFVPLGSSVVGEIGQNSIE
jgi:hypothetical protein